MYLNGFSQNWFVVNQQNARPSTGLGDTQLGFLTRRARLWFHGNVVNEKIGFRLQLETSPPDLGRIFMQEAWGSYQFNDDWKMIFGLAKLPFLREQLAAGWELLSVDRSPTSYFFNLNRQTQFQIQWFGSEFLRLYAALSNGTRRDLTQIPPRGYDTIGKDPASLAVTARAEWKMFGTWLLEYKSVAWSGTEPTAIIGAAINYQLANMDVTESFSLFPGNGDYLTFTVDGAWDYRNWHIVGYGFGAFIRHANENLQNRDMFGAQLEAAYLIDDMYQPFVRLEWINPDINGNDDPVFMTFGTNIYFAKQRLKWTTDLLWFFQGDAFNSLEINPFTEPVFIRLYGIDEESGDFGANNMIVFRTQLQVKF